MNRRLVVVALLLSALMVMSVLSINGNFMQSNGMGNYFKNANSQDLEGCRHSSYSYNGAMNNRFNTSPTGLDTSLSAAGDSAIAMSTDSMGNLFVLWSNGKVFERPDMGADNWIYIGNASAFGSYDNTSINLGTPVGIRSSYNWENREGQPVGMLMILFSNGYAAMATYGTNPITWTLSKLPGSNYISLSYNLNGYYYLGAHKQVFYATQGDGVTYGYSDDLYNWSPIINSTVGHNLTATLAWSNNFAPPCTGTVVMLGISKSGYVYFAEGSTNPLQSMQWTAEGRINATNPDFVGLTNTPDPSSVYYYYAIEGGKNSTLFASSSFNGSGPSFCPISNTTTPCNQTAIQNKYFGFQTGSDELILLQNGEIYQTRTEGASYEEFSVVPKTSKESDKIQVMPWIYQSSNLDQALQELNETHGNYTMVSYEFYQLMPDEEIEPFCGYTNSSNPANITPIVHRFGLGAVPMIVSASGQLIYYFTSNPYAMNLAINQMAQDAVLFNYTGYDIDWEPSSTNNTTGMQFDNFLNQFSLVLNKFGKKLFVEVASWDPDFWNFTDLGKTNVTSINIMDYNGLYNGSDSFTTCLEEGLNDVPLGKLSVSLENVNPNTCLNFTPSELMERFARLERSNIRLIGIWVMPFNISLVSELEDFELNATGFNYTLSSSPGSSGIYVSQSGNTTAGRLFYISFKNDYVYGNVTIQSNFAPGTILSSISYNYSGTENISLYAEVGNHWSLLISLSSPGRDNITLPAGSYNLRFVYGNFTGYFTDRELSEELSYSISFQKISYYGLVCVYYERGANLYVNGNIPASVGTEPFGQWNIAILWLLSGSYNISVEEYQSLGYYDNIVVTALHSTLVYSNVETLLGKVVGIVSPAGSSVTINGMKVNASSGMFTYCNVQGEYSIQVTMPFYRNYISTFTIERCQVSYLRINLSYLPPQPVLISIPVNQTGPAFRLSWSEFTGVDFEAYEVYLSTNDTSLGSMVYYTTTVSDTSYNLVNLSYSTRYYATVEVLAQGSSALSQKVSFETPSKPTPEIQQNTVDVYYIYALIAVSVVAAVSLGGLVFTRFKKK